jgi:hypothetical protein
MVALIALVVVVNVAQQIFFANSNEPPVVFHLLPFFGSTIEYGIDPPSFFKKKRAKVRLPRSGRRLGCDGSSLTGTLF